MYIRIHAKSADNEGSRGKNTQINTWFEPPTLELVRVEGEQPFGLPPWRVKVTGSGDDESSSGERGGSPRMTDKLLEMRLTPIDVLAIVNFAIRNGLTEAALADFTAQGRTRKRR